MKILLAFSFIPIMLIGIYPIISFIRFKYFANPVAKSDKFIAPVSIIIACFNEEKYIRNKITSFLDNDEWIGGSEIIVVSAGSTDKTNSILSEFKSNPSINIIFSERQLAKIEAVNLAVDYAKHEFLVFSDCRQSMKKGSLKQLIKNFNDKNVGTVAAKLIDPDENKRQSFFRATINKLVYYDSQYSSGLNVYGALYAQRKSIFQKFPQEQLFDDLCVITTTLSQNMRLVQEPMAVIYDVNFQLYYQGERLERLTRGLLIFLTKHWSQIIKINKFDLFRLLVFKYAKLLLPFSFTIWIVYCLMWFYANISLKLITLLLLSLGILILIKQTRLLILLAFRINIYFILAIIKYFILKRQSPQWEKLKVSINVKH